MASFRPGDTALAARLRRELRGEVLFDAFSRGRYSTDASIYQIEPIGVVVPADEDDFITAVQVALDAGVPILSRGGGTSQCGQTVGEALVIDASKNLNQVLDFDAAKRTVTVQPGLVLDQLNKQLKTQGLFYPVDVSTANRATLGGMAGNNSCGARSIRYGNMVHNVRAIDAVTAGGRVLHFGEVSGNLENVSDPLLVDLIERVRGVAAREAEELVRRFPKLLRRVGGYNLDSIKPAGHNLAHLLVGSEGTLAAFTRLTLDLQPIPAHKVLGICHFPTFYSAMDATQHIVKLDPAAVELVDRTMIELSRDIALYRDTVNRFIQGKPDAVLLVEFAGEDRIEQFAKLRQLHELMADLGFPGSAVEAIEPGFQNAIWEVRKAGLNIMMSMKGDGKPVSFIEDCAVALEDLAEYTDRLTQVFHKYGTSGTWYAHASVGCLHVRPILNMKDEADVKKMRAIAEEAFAMVREYKGSHSGEHGDGLVRSEFHEAMFGPRITKAFAEIKSIFDPKGLFNPGKIVNPPKMDERRLFRFKPGYRAVLENPVLDWSAWNGFAGAVEMCNNNGACRKADAGVMCPSYRVTRDEQHLTRGRANTLRLTLSGQLGPDGFTSEALYKALELCVSCKGCKRECPTGVDMAKMKIEALYHYQQKHGLSLRQKLIAQLPRYAPWASKLRGVLNLRDQLPGAAQVSEKILGFSAKRSLPKWQKPYTPQSSPIENADVALLADTFNRYFEPENLYAAEKVLQAAGYRVYVLEATDGKRPLCCGRTFLASGQVKQAKLEARRMLAAIQPLLKRGVPVVGLEPSCLFTLRDEFLAMLPGADTQKLAEQALLIEEFLAREQQAGRLDLKLRSLDSNKVLLHGHCHQKAFATMGAVEQTLKLIPAIQLETIASSCCGMAGAFGYEAEHYDISMRMAELSLLPAVRKAGAETLLVADGTSCRHQMHDGSGRQALHVVRVLERALDQV